VGFLTSFDIYNCEEPNPSIAIHTPFLSLTVWLAAMVHESSVIALWPSINDSILELQKNPRKTHSINCHFPLKLSQHRYQYTRKAFISTENYDNGGI